MYKLLGVSSSGYYAWVKESGGGRPIRRARSATSDALLIAGRPAAHTTHALRDWSIDPHQRWPVAYVVRLEHESAERLWARWGHVAIVGRV